MTGPRSGGLFVARYREYWDVELKQFAFRQTEFEAQKYVPYFNGGRVLAVRRDPSCCPSPRQDDAVPFYLQPTLGGSDELRGFVPYRFKDYHSVNLTAEHRWHAFSMLDMALFADAGKVVPLKRDVDVSRLHYSGGIGFRCAASLGHRQPDRLRGFVGRPPDGSGPSATSSTRISDAMSRTPRSCASPLRSSPAQSLGGAGAAVLSGRPACRGASSPAGSASRSGAR